MSPVTVTLLKAAGLWLILVVVAVANAAIRELLLAPAIGPDAALPASGTLLAVLILGCAWLAVPLFRPRETRTFVLIGVVWLVLTLAFELLFGHYVVRRSWSEIARVLDPRTGDLFLLALTSALVSPWVAARLRGLI
jgi:hypothetical protein